MLPTKDGSKKEESGDDPGYHNHKYDAVLCPPGAIACSYFDGAESVDGDEEDGVLGHETNGVVDGQPEVTDDRAEDPLPLEDVDEVEGHGDGADEEVRGGEGGDGIVGGLPNTTVHDECEEDEDVSQNGDHDADDHEEGDGYGEPGFEGREDGEGGV